MIKLDAKMLESHGFVFDTPEEAVEYLRNVVQYFKTCSRNLTEEQLRRIMIMISILECMEVE